MIDLPKDVQLSEVKYEKKTSVINKKIISEYPIKSNEIKKIVNEVKEDKTEKG